MLLTYDIEIDNEKIVKNLKRLTNQIYKLLPDREEGSDWQKPLEIIIEEFAGMNELFLDQHDIFFSLLCKLKGLFTLTNEEDFLLYRRVIFESLGLVSKLMPQCHCED